MITIIAGFGRCGSSLVMQMLHAAGYETTGEYPAFEDIRATALPYENRWLEEVEGKALKVIDPHRCQLPIDHDYKIIWLDRKPIEQAKSQMKLFSTLTSIKTTRKDIIAIAKSYKRDKPICLKLLKKLGPVLSMSFENLILSPIISAEKINSFLGDELDYLEMAKVVIGRPVFCMPGMDIEIQLIKEEKKGDI